MFEPMSTRCAAVVALLLCSCTAPTHVASAAKVPRDAVAAPDGALRAYLRGPSRAAYLAETLGAERQMVDIRLVNEGQGRVDVRGIRFDFKAYRGRVPFPCVTSDEPLVHGREVASLRAGESFTFVRRLDCATPLPGHYDVTMRLQLPGWTSDGGGKVLGGFALDVVARAEQPMAYPGREELYVLMTGAPLTRPLSPEGWSRGDYHVLVAAVNGGTTPVRVGPMRLSFRSRREGAASECAARGNVLPFPDVLEAGATLVLKAPLACPPSQEGVYLVVGSVALDDDSAAIEAGRLRLTVSSAPQLFAPPRLPPWQQRPLQ